MGLRARFEQDLKARLDAAEGKAVSLSGRLRRLCGDLIEGG
jgi:hypothetical protein